MDRRGFLRKGFALGLIGTIPRTISGEAVQTQSLPLRLNANENPLGLSPSAAQSIKRTLDRANRYPFQQASMLRERIGALHGISPEKVMLGNGSSEVLRLAVATLANQNPLVVAAEPTYEAVAGHSSILSLEVKRIPLNRVWAHDVQRMREVAKSYGGPVLIYICNPNNPTGTITDSAEIENWLRSAPSNHHFLIDEAYHHYVEAAEYKSFVDLAASMPNVNVTRTFSKVYAMAGLRLGYLVGSRTFVQQLQRRSYLNVNGLALAGAMASLEDRDFLKTSIESNSQAKQILTKTLDEIGRKHLPSHTNFVMMQIRGDHNRYQELMRAEGILVGRPFLPMTSYNRVSLGLPRETEFFVGKLREFHQKGWV